MTSNSGQSSDCPARVENEKRLRSAVLRGNEHAWETLYNDSYEVLARYVSWRCFGSSEQAEDVLQETWLTAVRKLKQFDPERGAFAAWLRGIAANVLRNRLRSRHSQVMENHDVQSLAMVFDAPGQPSAGDEMEERVAMALSLLPANYESVLREKYLAQRSVSEIASQFDQTPKAVESLLSRARELFRTIYLRVSDEELNL